MNRRYFINILATQDLKEIVDYFTVNNVEAGETVGWVYYFLQTFRRGGLNSPSD